MSFDGWKWRGCSFFGLVTDKVLFIAYMTTMCVCVGLVLYLCFVYTYNNGCVLCIVQYIDGMYTNIKPQVSAHGFYIYFYHLCGVGSGAYEVSKRRMWTQRIVCVAYARTQGCSADAVVVVVVVVLFAIRFAYVCGKMRRIFTKAEQNNSVEWRQLNVTVV